jgi:hypothetical protein
MGAHVSLHAVLWVTGPTIPPMIRNNAHQRNGEGFRKFAFMMLRHTRPGGCCDFRLLMTRDVVRSIDPMQHGLGAMTP